MGKRSDLELVKGWQTIRAEFEAMERMSCVPAGIKKVRADHIFDEENRLFYDLERIWRDGKVVEKEEIM